MRRPLFVANWKMHKSVAEARAFAAEFPPLLTGTNAAAADIALAPPATALHALGEALRGGGVALAAQNVYFETQGAFTGELSPNMLADCGCAYCIVGHSERRALFGESSALVARKAAALLAAGVAPIVCVGEALPVREAGGALDFLRAQTAESLAGLSATSTPQFVIAYEPVWAIGTGKSATPEIAQEAHAEIRARLAELFGADAAARVRILYGGSVKPANIADLCAQPDIDGALVGGAALQPESFAQIIAGGAPAGGKA